MLGTMSSGKLTRRGRIQTPGINRQESEESPEPSPIVPPVPMTPMVPPWTPQYAASATAGSAMIDDESLPSIPDVPSPYSPPPASLFSGEEFPPKSTRKPVSEVRITNSRRNSGSSRGGGSSGSSKENNHHNGRSIRFSNPSSSPKDMDALNMQLQDRSQLLPTVLYLKKDLEEAQQSQFLLQQENKALANECDRFQQEMAKWKNGDRNHAAELQAMQQRVDQANVEQQKALQEAAEAQRKTENLSRELAASQAVTTRLETENTQSALQFDALQADVRDLRAKAKEQSLNSTQRLKTVKDEYERKLSSLQDDYKSQSLEMDRLKAMLHEAKASNAHQDNAQVEIQRLETALEDATEAAEELRDQKAVLESEMAHKECALKDEIDHLTTQLEAAATSAATVAQQTTEAAESKELQEALADATEREDKLLVEKEALQTELDTKVNEMQLEMDQLQQALAKASAEKQSLQSSAQQKSQSLKESYTKYASLRAERDALQQEVTRTRKSLSASKATRPGAAADGAVVTATSELQDEVNRLQSALMQATSKCSELRAERSSLVKELKNSQQRNKGSSGGSPDGTLFSQHQSVYIGSGDDQTVDDMIPDRLGRIRDQAERAVLVKEYRRELNRLKLEHDGEIKRLTARHDKDLKDVFEEAKSEMSARARENRRRLQGEYEAKVAALERRYHGELARTQRECEKNTAVAEEAMQAAASEVLAVQEQLDEEQAARESLETKVRDLERKLVIEGQKSKLSAEHLQNRKQWQHETQTLLSNIQEECNQVFNQNKIVATKSPRTVVVAADVQPSSSSEADFSKIGTSDDDTFPATTPWKESTFKSTSYKSPLDVSLALDETEAMVRSLIG